MSLEDLVAAKKTQRDKDWPMLRRLVDPSYATARDGVVTDALVAFRLAKLRSPQFLVELVAAYPDAAAQSSRPVVQALLRDAEADARWGGSRRRSWPWIVNTGCRCGASLRHSGIRPDGASDERVGSAPRVGRL